MFEPLTQNFAEILAHPLSLFALIALAFLTIGFIYSKKIVFSPQLIVQTALMLALTIILHQLRLYHMPQGGSITFGAMLPLLLLSFRYGPGVGFLAGFLYGMINLLQDPFIVHPLQVLFDYPLPYMALGLAGYFKGRFLLGAILAITGRFICHFISGAIFFGSYAPEGTSPYVYSFLFNATYLVPELIICLILLKILPIKKLLEHMYDGRAV